MARRQIVQKAADNLLCARLRPVIPDPVGQREMSLQAQAGRIAGIVPLLVGRIDQHQPFHLGPDNRVAPTCIGAQLIQGIDGLTIGKSQGWPDFLKRKPQFCQAGKRRRMLIIGRMCLETDACMMGNRGL